MKHLLSLLTIFTNLYSNAQSLKEGDNLKMEFKKIAKPYYFAAPKFTGWIEGANMLVIADKLNPK